VTVTTEEAREHSLDVLMRSQLPAFARYAEEVAQEAENEGWSFRRYLHHLAELEIEERRQRRIDHACSSRENSGRRGDQHREQTIGSIPDRRQLT
jgi:DNA replication protein DnaC